MTTSEAVQAALDARVDAIGFVFAESKRQVTPQRAAQLAAPARGRVKCVAVTRHPQQSAVDEILSVFNPDVLQTDVEDFRALNLPATLERLPVVRAGGIEPKPLPSRLLFEGPVSGTGIPADWLAARVVARRGATDPRWRPVARQRRRRHQRSAPVRCGCVERRRILARASRAPRRLRAS